MKSPPKEVDFFYNPKAYTLNTYYQQVEPRHKINVQYLVKEIQKKNNILLA